MSTITDGNTGTNSAPVAERFSGRLRRIREEGRIRSALALRQRSDADLARSHKLMSGYDFLDAVERMVRKLQEQFADEAGGFGLSRRLFDGGYELALHTRESLRDQTGRPGRYISRIVFLLHPDLGRGRFRLLCRKTVRNRDLPSDFRENDMGDASLQGFRTFAQDQFLEFAKAWFDRGDLTRTDADEVVTAA